MPRNAKDSVVIAERLLKLVQSISEPNVDPLVGWNTKIEIQNVCDSLLANILGPLEQTILIAGTSLRLFTSQGKITYVLYQSLATSRQLFTSLLALELPI
jgi:hypothetical protein